MLRDLSNTNFSVIPMNIVGIIIYVIVGVTFLTYLLTMYGLKHLGPTISSTYIYAQPVMVIFFTIIFATLNWTSIDSSSSITTLKFGLMMLIFIGVYLSSSKKNKI
jgi:drug/metabolite transporter (DMT)-like permease